MLVPNIGQLYYLWQNRGAIGGFTTNLYWSSTTSKNGTSSPEYVSYVYFVDGSIGPTTIGSPSSLRCIK